MPSNAFECLQMPHKPVERRRMPTDALQSDMSLHRLIFAFDSIRKDFHCEVHSVRLTV